MVTDFTRDFWPPPIFNSGCDYGYKQLVDRISTDGNVYMPLRGSVSAHSSVPLSQSTSEKLTDRVTAEQLHAPVVDGVTGGNHGDTRLQQVDVVVFPRLNDRLQLVLLSAHRHRITDTAVASVSK